MLADGVLDRQWVQVQLLGDRPQLFAARRAVVKPDKDVRFDDPVGDLADGEVLAHELAIPVEPRASHLRTIWPGPDRAAWSTPPAPVALLPACSRCRR